MIKYIFLQLINQFPFEEVVDSRNAKFEKEVGTNQYLKTWIYRPQTSILDSLLILAFFFFILRFWLPLDSF